MGSELVAVLVSASHDATGPGFKALGRHLRSGAPCGGRQGPASTSRERCAREVGDACQAGVSRMEVAAAAVFYSKLARHW
jgi:hypothetical protein